VELQKAGQGAKEDASFLQQLERVENPLLEMIYKSPQFRDFQFDFIFYPRDEREAVRSSKNY
jgi:hypothetical protein